MNLTLCLLKPDAVRRRLVPALLEALDSEGLVPVRMGMFRAMVPTAAEHYRAHASKPYFGELVDFTCSGPLVALVLAPSHPALDAVATLREAMGPCDGAAPGTIRADFRDPAARPMENLVHGSDSPEEAEREARIWFGDAGLSGV